MTTTGDPTWLRGSWMQTSTGRRFYPLDPQIEDIDSIDIAHALSQICRYGGHTVRHYSVAEHCVLLSRAVEPEYAAWALLHDATEAYVGDMVRPLKQRMPDYRAIEDRIMVVIAWRFGLAGETIPEPVKDADTRILLDEREVVMAVIRHGWDQDGLDPLGVNIRMLPAHEAEMAYRRRMDELGLS